MFVAGRCVASTRGKYVIINGDAYLMAVGLIIVFYCRYITVLSVLISKQGRLFSRRDD